jgi:sortase A
MEEIQKKKMVKVTVFALEALAVLLLVYLVGLPLYPALKYKVSIENTSAFAEAKNVEAVKEETQKIYGGLPQAEYDISPNRIIIPKIGVNAPIVESNNSEYGLSLGAWHVPESSTPDRGGNTVITGHRFKYLPPSNLTFYLFHKLEIGDIASVIWDEEEYYYEIKQIKIIEPTEVSILDATVNPTLTMFTCHPIYSTDKRLVVVAELISSE